MAIKQREVFRMREFLTKQLQRARIVATSWDKFQRMLISRDTAVAKRDTALAGGDAVLIQGGAIAPGIPAIRDILTAQGDHSHTSTKFQDSLMQFIRSNSDFGGSIIEVGCYRG